MVERIHVAAEKIGYPVFLRTDYTSGKHDWKDTCYLTRKEDISEHLISILIYSECVHWAPVDVWVVREMLPTIKHGVFRAYGDMPVVKEFDILLTVAKSNVSTRIIQKTHLI